MTKKVLIITYYWPPSAGSGVQRWLKFAKYLPDSGWQPVIFTPENPDFDLQDSSLENEVPDSLEVLKLPIWEPYHLLDKLRGKSDSHPGRVMEKGRKSWLEKASIWARANLLIPDPRVFWVKPAVKFLSGRIKNGEFDAIITTGPPHSMHLIGRALRSKYPIYWIADFRDPWSQWEFLDTLPMQESVRKKHKKLEKEVLTVADQVLTISPTFQRDLENISGRKVTLLTNGFDSADLPADFRPDPDPDLFHLVYTGIIDAIRNPIPLLRAFKEEFSQTQEKVKFTFVGRVSGTVKEYVSADHWLSQHVNFAGYVSHQKVFTYYAAADVLILILTNTKNAQGNIPGKLFEYMSTGLPILAIGDKYGDSAKILNDSKAGAVIGHREHAAMQVELRRLYEGRASAFQTEDIAQFSRKNLTKKLVDLLNGSPLS
ncbi:glycosyltransferase family 4 protein [Algoriphagus namhaensis]